MKAVQYFLARLAEPSTWNAISVILALCGVSPAITHALGSVISVAPDVLGTILLAGAGSAATAGFAMPEKAKQNPISKTETPTA